MVGRDEGWGLEGFKKRDVNRVVFLVWIVDVSVVESANWRMRSG